MSKFKVQFGSPLGMHGNKGLFEQKLREGYTEYSYGIGESHEPERIVALFAFYHPEGRIATYEHAKHYRKHPGRQWRMPFAGKKPVAREYDSYSFVQHVVKEQIFMMDGVFGRGSLADLVENVEWK